MAKKYSEISVKAAAITGAVYGLLSSLLVVLLAGSMMAGYGMMGSYGGAPLVVVSAAYNAVIFGFVAVLYNYVLGKWVKS